MSKEPELKARDKVVVRMTREGAVEENLTAGTEQRVSKRLEDAELVKPAETAAPSEALSAEEQKKVQMRRQQRQFQAEHAENNDTQPPLETSVTEEKRADNPPQNAPEPLPSSETSFKPPVLEQHGVSSHTGTVIAETVVTHKLRKTSAVEAVDADAVLSQAAETASAKPIIDAATDTCDPQGRHLLIEDDDPSHRVMTAYYTVPGTSACGVTLYASMIPLSPEERMPSGVVNRFEAGALKGYTAKVSIPDGTWMTSNHRLDPEERKLRMEKTMALSYDMWKDKPALSGNVGVFSSISFPNLNYLGDVDNAECIAGLLEGAVVLGKLRI